VVLGCFAVAMGKEERDCNYREDGLPAKKEERLECVIEKSKNYGGREMEAANKDKPKPPVLKVPIPMAEIHDPWKLKPIHSMFKCPGLLDPIQINRCTECFRKGSPAPWEVVAFQANNAQCRVGHEIIPVSFLDAGIAARTPADQVMIEAQARSSEETEDEAEDEAEAEDEVEADDEDELDVDEEDEDSDEAEDEDEVEAEDEADEEADEEDSELIEDEESIDEADEAEADDEDEAEIEDEFEAEDEAEADEEVESEDEAEAEEEAEEEGDAETEEEAAADQSNEDMAAFLEVAHAQIDRSMAEFRDENEL